MSRFQRNGTCSSRGTRAPRAIFLRHVRASLRCVLLLTLMSLFVINKFFLEVVFCCVCNLSMFYLSYQAIPALISGWAAHKRLRRELRRRPCGRILPVGVNGQYTTTRSPAQ